MLLVYLPNETFKREVHCPAFNSSITQHGSNSGRFEI